MSKALGFFVGLCIFSFVFLRVSFVVTEGRPIARAAMGGIGILCYFLVMHFAPNADSKRETNRQKFVYGLEIIMMFLSFLFFVLVIGMIQESLEELGYISGNVCIECGP